MPFVITPADLAAFGRCRRQWDFGARARRNLQPLRQPAAPGLGQALREALAIYYFPGMWDWERKVTLPLVVQGLDRALAAQRAGRAAGEAADGAVWDEQREAGRGLLARYFDWARAADGFSPVLVEAEYDVNVPDPARPPDSVLTWGGEPVRYRGQIDMLAVDEHDAYWIVRHHLAEGDWRPAQALIDDEEALTACWAWEHFYLGMAITGTIHNEVRLHDAAAGGPPGPGRPAAGLRRLRLRRAGRGGLAPGGAAPRVRQHEPSGGGRSIPQHRRMYATAREPPHPERIEHQVTEEFRRTWIRRSQAEIAAAGDRLGAAAAIMTDPGLRVRANPSWANCSPCPFLAPCEAGRAGRDPEPLLRLGYRERPAEKLQEGRLGGGAWSTGRGAAPPKFRGR